MANPIDELRTHLHGVVKSASAVIREVKEGGGGDDAAIAALRVEFFKGVRPAAKGSRKLLRKLEWLLQEDPPIRTVTDVEFREFTKQVDAMHLAQETWRRLLYSQEDVNVLHHAAPHVFRLIDHALTCYVILAICRLVDWDRTSGRENLTLKVVLEDTNWTDRQRRKQIAEESLQDVMAVMDGENGIRKLRNTYLSHFDRACADDPRKWPATRMDDIDSAVGAIVACHEEIKVVRKWGADPAAVALFVGEVEELLAQLQAGADARGAGDKPGD